MLWNRIPLVRQLFSRLRLLCACVLIAPAAVASPESAQTREIAQTASLPARALDRNELRNMLAVGFDTISERYIDPVSPPTLAIHAIRGLGALDPALAVSMRGGRLFLANANGVFAAARPPRDADAARWASFSAAMVEQAVAASPALRRASAEEFYRAMFDASLSQLDRYSRYSSRDEAQRRRARRSGFNGIGVSYRVEGGALVLTRVHDGTPAARAGLKAGERIVSVNGEDVAAFAHEPNGARKRLRGPRGAKISLVVARGGALKTVTLRRDLVTPQTVSVSSANHGVPIIKITGFNAGTANALKRQIVRQRQSLGAGFHGLVLDVRGNPGGLLDQAVAIADLFITHGPLVSTRGRHPEARQYYEARPDDILAGGPLAVLVDGRSASSAEIVAAALQDSGRAVAVGSASFGKGSVQTVVRLPNDGEMTLTWARFRSPSGYVLQGLGVLPIICVRDRRTPPRETLRQALGSPMRRVLATLWRSTPLSDVKGRSELRSHCPPRRQESWRLDEDVARRLVLNNDLYAQALASARP